MKIARQNLIRILKYLKPYLFKEFGLGLTMVLVVLLSLIDPLLLKMLIDDVLVKPDPDRTLFTVIVIALIGLAALRIAFFVLSAYLYNFVGQKILFDVRLSLFQHLQKLHLGFFTRTKTGEIMSRVNNDVERLQNVLTTTVVSLVTDILTLFAILAIMLYLHWKLALVSLALFPFFFVSQIHFGKKIKHKSKDAREKSADILSFFQETFAGIRLVQSFVREKFEARRLVRKSKSLIKTRISLGMLGALASSIAGFLAALGPIVVLSYGGYEVINGTLTIGGLMAFYTYVGRLFSPVSRLAQHNVSIQTARASIDRIFEFMDIKPAITDNPGSNSLPEVTGRVVFKDVSFRYQPDEPLLENISLEIVPGQTVALVGRSGAGKSTIVSLMCRFYDPQSGYILLDGYDLRNIKLGSLRKHIGLVSQETILFNATIRENILYGDPRAGDDQIREAARKAHIEELIESLPLKYETIIGDMGIRLSGGERQRLSIARTILKNPGILVLDEAMSSLDSKSEKLIQESIEPLIENRTCLVIAHRLSTISNADNILILYQGHLVASGKHEYLLMHNSLYKMLWDEMARENKIK